MMRKFILMAVCLFMLCLARPSTAVQYNQYYTNEASSHKGYVEAYVDYNLQQYWILRGAKRINNNLVIIPNKIWNANIYDEEFERLTILYDLIITGAADKYNRVEQYWTTRYYSGNISHKEFQKKLALIESNREAEERAKRNDWRQQLAEQRSRENEQGSTGAWYYENGSKYLKDAPGNGYYRDKYPPNYYPYPYYPNYDYGRRYYRYNR